MVTIVRVTNEDKNTAMCSAEDFDTHPNSLITGEAFSDAECLRREP